MSTPSHRETYDAASLVRGGIIGRIGGCFSCLAGTLSAMVMEKVEEPIRASEMKRSSTSRGAFAILVALPVCGVVLHGPPAMVFFIGAISFILGVMLLVWLLAASSMPRAGSPPVAGTGGQASSGTRAL